MIQSIIFIIHYRALNPVFKEQFLKNFNDIVDGTSTTKSKFRKKHDDEKTKRDTLNAELFGFIELQRKYASLIKEFKIACEKSSK